jgi:hypothetical protein
MKRRSWIIIIVSLLGRIGCINGSSRPAQDSPRTRLDHQDIIQRADKLNTNMTRQDVLHLLGRPSLQGEDIWQYLPSRPGPEATTLGLRIRFKGDQYADHKYIPMSLGD